MRQLFLSIVFMCGLAMWCPAQESTPLRLVFYNMEWFPGGSPRATIPEAVTAMHKMIPVLEALRPDIIGATEMSSAEALDVALARVPGVLTQVCSVFTMGDGTPTIQQIAIASKLPAASAWWEGWSVSKAAPPRGFAFAAYEPSPGSVLLVYTVHLKSNRGDLPANIAMREESARQLLDHVRAMEKAYASMGHVAVVIGGDFNSSLDDPKFAEEKTLTMFKKAGFDWSWADVPFEQRVTLPSSPSMNPRFPPFPDACFDHAFVKGAKILSASVYTPETDPSDHRPIIIEIDLVKK